MALVHPVDGANQATRLRFSGEGAPTPSVLGAPSPEKKKKKAIPSTLRIGLVINLDPIADQLP